MSRQRQRSGGSLGVVCDIVRHPQFETAAIITMSENKEDRMSFVDGWEFMQTLGEGAYGE